MRRVLPIAVFLLAGAAVQAAEATFDITLAGATLGRISVAGTDRTARLATVMDNTPMGVGDGRFDATYRAGEYRSLGQSPGDRRRIEIDFDEAQVASVRIDPVSEATDASQPSVIPAGVLDPARGFARIALAPDCVGGFRLYDGRRVVRVTPAGRAADGGTVTCRYDYRVTGGPGHLSPFRFRSVTVVATYGATRGVQDIALAAGPFTVRLVKR